jgi:hypothetical protein
MFTRKRIASALTGAVALVGLCGGPALAKVTANDDHYNRRNPHYQVSFVGNRAVLTLRGSNPNGIFDNDRMTGKGHLALRGIDEIAGVHRVVVKRMPNGTTRIVIHFVHNFEGNALLRYRVAEVRHGRVVGFDHARIHIRVDCVQGSCS